MKKFLVLLCGLAMTPSVHAGDGRIPDSEVQNLKSVEQIEQGEFAEFLGILNTVRPPRPSPPRHRPGPPPRRPNPPPRPRPRPPGYPVRPAPGYFVCYAEDSWGRRYDGWDRVASWAQREALNECEWNSPGYCRALGCRRHY